MSIEKKKKLFECYIYTNCLINCLLNNTKRFNKSLIYFKNYYKNKMKNINVLLVGNWKMIRCQTCTGGVRKN